MKKLSLIGAMLLTACVTINIYFPAAAAEKAADQIIKEIQENKPAKKTEPKAQTNEWQQAALHGLALGLNYLITPALAEEADLDIDSEDIRRIQAKMKARFSSLDSFYSKGFIGIKRDGLLAVKEASNIPLKDRNAANKLVGAENSDREALYHAIADANGHSDWYGQIKQTFAERWISNAQSGWWYEVSNNNWKQK